LECGSEAAAFAVQADMKRSVTPSPGPPRLMKTPVRSTLSRKGERATPSLKR
jgi:hypothetical protein